MIPNRSEKVRVDLVFVAPHQFIERILSAGLKLCNQHLIFNDSIHEEPIPILSLQTTLNELSLIKNHYKNLKLLMNIKKFFKKNEINKIIHFMKKDKKNVSNKISLILLKKIGKTTKPGQIALKDSEIKKFLNSYYS